MPQSARIKPGTMHELKHSGQIHITEQQKADFDCDGFVIVPSVLSDISLKQARSRFDPLFNGEFETGVQPDEWNWRRGRDDPALTRQLCNAWKSDRTIASIVLREDIGAACAALRQWQGARINQDNVIWKPPGTKALGFHQDDSYQKWIVPSEMMTCWITLDDTKADQGTIEYVRGSHKWPVSEPIEKFHAPDDPLADMQLAAHAAGETPDIVPIEVTAGSAVLHHGRTWHGSRSNRGAAPRRSVVAHCMSGDAKFHASIASGVYSRYKKHDTLDMDENFFPVIWRADGYRSQWLDNYITSRP